MLINRKMLCYFDNQLINQSFFKQKFNSTFFLTLNLQLCPV